MKPQTLRLRCFYAVAFLLAASALLPRGFAQTLEHRYSFNDGTANDYVGGANGTLVGNAYISNNMLVLPGGGNSDNPSGYVNLPNGIVTNCTSITVEAWLTDTAGSTWAEAWCFGDSAAGPGNPPSSGTAYISLIPHSGEDDFRAAFNLTGSDEIDVVDTAGPLPLNTEEYAAVTYDAPSATASLYLNGALVATANIPTNLAPSNYSDTFNDWFGRDEFGADPMFAGSLDEVRIWNAAMSPMYISMSAAMGPNVLLTNFTPQSLTVSVPIVSLSVGQPEQASAVANFAQVTNVNVTSAITNWVSSNPAVLTVNSAGLISAISPGTATVTGTLDGINGTSAVITVSSPIAGSVTVAYWQFDSSANLGFDSSGSSNELVTSSGEPVYSSAGPFGGSLYLDGESTLTTASGVLPVGTPTGAAPYTIAVWEKVDTGCPNNGGFIGWGVNGPSECNNFRLGDLDSNSDALDDYWYGNDFYVDGLSDNPADGNWHALAVTWDGTNEILYVDGVNVGSRLPTSPAIQSGNFIVGKTTADVNFKGWMEDLLIANAALAPAELQVYQAGEWSPTLSNFPLQPTASPSNTVYSGTMVTLTALDAGSPPFQYQWQDNGTNISWGTAGTLVITNAQIANSGSYTVVIANSYATNTSPALTLTVLPATPPVFLQQPSPASSTNYQGGLITLTASATGSLPLQLQWQHNGTNIFNATSSTLTLASLQPFEAGNYTLVASNAFGVTNSLPAALTILPPPNPSALNVLTYHYDNTRQGQDTNEVLLTPNTVNVHTFGRLITYDTDGNIIAQPLYVYGLQIPGQGTHNTVFVATENNSVYAFDADNDSGTNAGLLWHVNLGPPALSYTGEFGTRYQGTYYGDIAPVVGITGTPVINLASGTLYVSVHTREVTATSTNYFHRIHALNITNGMEQPYSPVVVTNSMAGTGVDGTNGIVSFDTRQENQRPALAYANGMLYVAYGSYEDTDPYHGWVFGFNATNLAMSSTRVFNTTPNATVAAFGANAGEGALWMGGDGVCVDASNNLFFATANGSFSQETNGGDYGDSIVKLSTTNGFQVADYFTPYNQAYLASADLDLGSGGTVLLPDAVGSVAHPHLLVAGGKEGTIHLVDRDNMGRFNSANDNQIVQELNGAVGAVRSTPAYFNNTIYYQGDGDVMRAFYISNAVINPAPVSTTAATINAPGGTPIVTANGVNNGIVWVVSPDAYGGSGPAVLYAYAATNLAVELYNSSQDLARDNPGPAVRMNTVTAINGKVFVGGQYTLSIFGNSLFLATPVISPAGGSFANSTVVSISESTPNSTIYYTLDGTVPTTNSPIYTGPFTLNNSASVQAIAAQLGTPNSAVATASFVDTSAVGTGTGLLGSYWTNLTATAFTNASFSRAPTLQRTDPTINFNWAATPPAPTIGLTNFVVRWTGTVQPEYGETYTFSTYAAGGARLFINGQLLINQWTNQPATTWSNSVRLVAQQLYNVELDYFNQTGGAAVQLYWSSPSTPNAIIPQSQLYPYTNPPPTVVLDAPAGGATYTASASVTLAADADAPYNPISGVTFYANNDSLGTVTNIPYTLTATGLAAGNYALSAVATDSSGLSSTSVVASITVNAGSGLPYGLTSNATISPFLNMPTTYAGSLPAQLSLTGVFSNTPNMVPSPGLIPYVPNVPFWSDGALKTRYMAVPNNGGAITPGEQISFSPTNYWTFPAGTIFVKTFQLNTDTSNPNALRRLETRLLVRDINGAVYGVTYKWRSDNSDADLLTSSLSENILITNGSQVITQTWYYPSPSDCLTCHTPVANYVLGVNARQLNGTETYPSTGVTDNQLRTLNRLGMFNPSFDEGTIPTFPKLSSLTNQSASLEDRSRSYFDANCAQCHQPGGTGITFDARYTTPLAYQNVTNYPAAFNLGYDNACIVKSQDVWRSMIWQRMNTTNNAIKMPPLARNLIDSNAVAVISAWINSLPGTPAEAPPAIVPNGGNYNGPVGVSMAAPDTNAIIYYTLNGSLPTTNSLLYTGVFNLTSNATVSASAWRTNYNNSVATSALFIITPAYFASEQFAANHQFQLNFIGVPGSNYVLQATTNFVNWTPLSTNTATTSSFMLFDARATNFPYRFYRVVQQPASP